MKIRILMLLTIVLMYTGCAPFCVPMYTPVSNAVSRVGARAIYGESKLTPNVSKVKVIVQDCGMYSSTGSWCGYTPPLPYQLLPEYNPKHNPSRACEDAVVISIDPKRGWDFPQNSKLLLDYKGKKMLFTVGNAQHFMKIKTDEVFLEHRYRKWYGYPAQGLMVVTLPVEVVLNATGLSVPLRGVCTFYY